MAALPSCSIVCVASQHRTHKTEKELECEPCIMLSDHRPANYVRSALGSDGAKKREEVLHSRLAVLRRGKPAGYFDGWARVS